MRKHLFSKIMTMALCAGFLLPAARADEQKLPATKVAASDSEKALPGRSNPETPQPLTEKESEALRARSEEPGEKVAGGALSNLHLTYIVIALATAVIVIIAL